MCRLIGHVFYFLMDESLPVEIFSCSIIIVSVPIFAFASENQGFGIEVRVVPRGSLAFAFRASILQISAFFPYWNFWWVESKECASQVISLISILAFLSSPDFRLFLSTSHVRCSIPASTSSPQ
jgi:hypothetical protein